MLQATDTTHARRRIAEALRAHRQPEDDMDLDRIMASFAADAVMEVNGRSIGDLAAIRAFHATLGFATGGALSDIAISEDRSLLTDDHAVLEGYVRGRHTGDFMGMPASQRTVELPYCALYRFNDGGKLAHERVYIDVTPLFGP
jgi:hypothetical protein